MSFSPNSTCFPVRLWLILFLALVFSACNAFAQPVSLSNGSRAFPPIVRGSERRILDRAQQFIHDEQWGDALALFMRLLESPSATIVPLEEQRYEGLRRFCHRQIASFPPTALARYRQLVDAISHSIYEQGLVRRDESLLQRVVDEYFCSSWGDDALLTLGEMALQRGDYARARRAWLQLSSNNTASEGLMKYPLGDYSHAELEAWLVLASIRERDFLRAERELQNFEKQYSNAEGRIGGKTVPLAAALSQVFEQARDWSTPSNDPQWPTFAGNSQRSSWRPSALPQGAWKLVAAPSISNPQRAAFPVIISNRVVCFDGKKTHTFDLVSNEPSGIAHFAASTNSLDSVAASPPAANTLGCFKHFAYGVTQLSGNDRAQRNRNLESTCWGIDLQREGALTLRLRTSEPSVKFTAAPVVDDRRLWLPVQSEEMNPRVGIACFDRETGSSLWQTWLGQVSSSGESEPGRSTPTLLAEAAGLLFVNTNSGIIAAVDAESGEIVWMRTYSTVPTQQQTTDLQHQSVTPNPCIFSGNSVYVLPTDSNQLLAINSLTGALNWQLPRKSSNALLLGATGEFLLLSDEGLQLLNLTHGSTMYSESQLKLEGYPAIAGRVILWPESSGVRFLEWNGQVLQQVEMPLEIAGGANLALSDQWLVAASRKQVHIYRLQSKEEATAVTSQPPRAE